VFRSTHPGKLGIEIVELKWGQGAKDIGGEVKIKDLAKAQMLKSRGYVVFPDPSDPEVIEAFKRGVFSEFERHSRVGMVTEDGFMDRVQELRSAGAKHVFLKTGAYRPADLARAIKFASMAKIDLLTVDAAGGGTVIEPVENDERMGNAAGRDILTALPVRRQTRKHGRVRARHCSSRRDCV